MLAAPSAAQAAATPPATTSATSSGPTAYAAEADLLAERVRTIAAESPSKQFPLGAGNDFKLRFVTGSDWNSGFLAGALWQASRLTGLESDAQLARRATRDHFGFERTKLHDLGFMYYGSSVMAYEMSCLASAPATAACNSFRRSGLSAARSLRALAASTGRGIIPMSAKTCSHCRRGDTETIVDSMMNLPLLYWAGKQTGDRRFATLARRHANWVRAHLIRRDFSTYQSGSYSRKARRGSVRRHTHQGVSNSGVWARGQAWAIYGFADAGAHFRDKGYIETSERAAEYVARRLPKDGLPRWDYRAGSGARGDVSAGVITAAGLFRLEATCKAVKNSCASAELWGPLARRILSASLADLRSSTPVGYLGGQVYNMRNKESWDDDAELMFGLQYALEAISLARAAG